MVKTSMRWVTGTGHTLLNGFTNEAAVAIMHGAAVLWRERTVTVKTRGRRGTVRVRFEANRFPNSQPGFVVEVRVNGEVGESLETHATPEWAMAHFVQLVGAKQATRAVEKAAMVPEGATEPRDRFEVEAVLREYTYPEPVENASPYIKHEGPGLGCKLSKAYLSGRWCFVNRMSITARGLAMGGADITRSIDDALAHYDAHTARKEAEAAARKAG